MKKFHLFQTQQGYVRGAKKRPNLQNRGFACDGERGLRETTTARSRPHARARLGVAGERSLPCRRGGGRPSARAARPPPSLTSTGTALPSRRTRLTAPTTIKCTGWTKKRHGGGEGRGGRGCMGWDAARSERERVEGRGLKDARSCFSTDAFSLREHHPHAHESQSECTYARFSFEGHV